MPPYSLHSQHSVVSVMVTDDETWESKSPDRHKRLCLVCQTGSHLPFPPRPSQSCSRALSAKLSSQGACKERCQQLLLAFSVSNSAKDPSAPTSRYCWEAEPCRIQLWRSIRLRVLCHHMGFYHPTHFRGFLGFHHPTHSVQLQWPCPQHCDTWHTPSRTGWVLSAFCLLSWGTAEVSRSCHHFLPLPSN